MTLQDDLEYKSRKIELLPVFAAIVLASRRVSLSLFSSKILCILSNHSFW